MKKNKTLLLVDNLEIVSKLSNRDITFLFPIKDYTVGFNNTFKIEDIPQGGFIFINRIMDNKSIIALRELLLNLPSNIKGIVFDDLGVLNILLDIKLDITKILFLNHFNCNYESINCYLEYLDSVVVSPDITYEEIDEILDKAIKKVVLYTFGYVNIMYSRRKLITNYNHNFKKEVENIGVLEDNLTKTKLNIIENEYGTVIYTENPFNGLNLRYKKNVLYNLINTVFLTNEEVLTIIDSKDNLDDIYPFKYLSMKKTIFKVKERE